jgi:hypothetical protein
MAVIVQPSPNNNKAINDMYNSPVDTIYGLYLTTTSNQERNWWFNPDNPNAYSIFNLDEIYDENYHTDGHLTTYGAQNYLYIASGYCNFLLGQTCRSFMEFGVSDTSIKSSIE